MKPKYIESVIALGHGGVIAYPTESVYGLGCDPFNEAAVFRLLQLKRRPVNKGLILVAASVSQLSPWLDNLPAALYERCCESWPGPVTWVVPQKLLFQSFPRWIVGDFDSVALRVSSHPDVQNLCYEFGGPIVSTSANITGHRSLKTALQVRVQLGRGLDAILVGKVGKSPKPTTIKELSSGKVLRC